MFDIREWVEDRKRLEPAAPEDISAMLARRYLLLWGSGAALTANVFAHFDAVIGFSHLVTKAVALWVYWTEEVWRYLAELVNLSLPLGMGNVLSFAVFLTGTALAGKTLQAAQVEPDVRKIAHYLLTAAVVVMILAAGGEAPGASSTAALAVLAAPFATYLFAGPMRTSLSRLFYAGFVLLACAAMLVVPLSRTSAHAQ